MLLEKILYQLGCITSFHVQIHWVISKNLSDNLTECLTDTAFHICILGVKFCLRSQVQMYRAHTGLRLCMP